MKNKQLTPKEQCDEYYNFYLSLGLTLYECKRCTIHLLNELIKLHTDDTDAGTWGYKAKLTYLNEIKFHATQL
jgi:hypothetical protein